MMSPDNLRLISTHIDKFITSNQFTRTIDDRLTYTYLDGFITRVDYAIKLKTLTTVRGVPVVQGRFVTMDIECRLSAPDSNGNQQFTPYAVGIYTAFSVSHDADNGLRLFWLPDYNSPTEMIEAAFNYLSHRKFRSWPVYFHNLNGFDLPFIINVLLKSGRVKVIRRDSTIIEIKYYPNVNPKNYISIRDSFLLLPGSLDNLSKTFRVDQPKTAFPHNFVNNHPLDYIGDRPDQSYWPTGKTPTGPVNNWVLKTELLDYLQSDVISLWQVIAEFTIEIHRHHHINVLKYLTLPSLAFAIYRSNYYDIKDTPISLIHGKVDNAIRQSYFGGLVDAFIPYGENLFKYDINSSYPHSMKLDMPIGQPTFIDGININLNDPNIFGFYNCEVTTPNNSDDFTPVLPFKSNGKVITPIGTWTGWYFTEELRAAVKLGYNVKLLHGYNFHRGKPFDRYIDYWYGVKSSSPKDSFEYLMSKLFLNSLYGRFGMKPELTQTEIITVDKLDSYLDHKVLDNITYLDDDYVMVDSSDPNTDSDNDFHEMLMNINSNLYSDKPFLRSANVNVAIASAITAYSRININQYKNLPGNPCYYSDTDSVVLAHPLPAEMVCNHTLGKMKLEYEIAYGIYAGPKTYYDEFKAPIKGKAFECKIKGLSEVKPTQGLQRGANKPTFAQMYSLLNVDTELQLEHQLWLKDLKSGTIIIKHRPYKLRMTFTKRLPIYKGRKLVGTKPLYINRC